jgi:hypothetical protein
MTLATVNGSAQEVFATKNSMPNGASSFSTQIAAVPPNALNYSQKEELERATSTYTWFSEENQNLAVTAFNGAIDAHAQGRLGIAQFLLTSIIDHYHKDVDLYDYHRAKHARAVLRRPSNQEPIQLEGIPTLPPMAYGGSTTSYTRTIRSVGNWVEGAPVSMINDIAVLVRYELPDDMYIVEYIPRVIQVDVDPIVYAKYGKWYVKIAQWG